MAPYSQTVFTLWLVAIWRWTRISYGVWDSCLQFPLLVIDWRILLGYENPRSTIICYHVNCMASHSFLCTYHAVCMMELPSWCDSVYLCASSVFSALPHKLKMLPLNKGYMKEVSWATDIWMQFFSSSLIHGNYPSGIEKMKYDRQRINKFSWESSLHGLHASFSQPK